MPRQQLLPVLPHSLPCPASRCKCIRCCRSRCCCCVVIKFYAHICFTVKVDSRPAASKRGVVANVKQIAHSLMSTKNRIAIHQLYLLYGSHIWAPGRSCATSQSQRRRREWERTCDERGMWSGGERLGSGPKVPVACLTWFFVAHLCIILYLWAWLLKMANKLYCWEGAWVMCLCL